MGLKKIISGGQSGAEIAGIDAAIEHGMPYGGWLPKGRKTENGPLNVKYTDMIEMPDGDYPERTEQNVKDADGTVIFTHGQPSDDSALTNEYAIKNNKPLLHIDLDILSESSAIESLMDWINEKKIEVLNVAGSPESQDEYIYDEVHSIFKSIIKTIKSADIPPKLQAPPAIQSALADIIETLQVFDEITPAAKGGFKVSIPPARDGNASTPQEITEEVTTEREEEQAYDETAPARKGGVIAPKSPARDGATAIPQVITEEVTTEREEVEDTAGVAGLASLIERLPKAIQKNLKPILLSILILTTALMLIPGVLKNYSSENTSTQSLPLPEGRDSKITGSSGDSIPAAGSTPETVPQSVSSLPTTTNPTEQAGMEAPPSEATTSGASQDGASKNNPDIQTDNPSMVAEQPEKTANDQKDTPVNDSAITTESSNGGTNAILQPLSDTSGEAEKKQAPQKKEQPNAKNRCASLYKKISSGKVLDKAETDYLTHSCN